MIFYPSSFAGSFFARRAKKEPAKEEICKYHRQWRHWYGHAAGKWPL
jgi:hypothetical protein